MPRKISFERLSSSQRKIEGGAEGARKKKKARKELATEQKESGPQTLRSEEEIAQETEGLVSAKSKKEEMVDLGSEKVKKEYLELEEIEDEKAVELEEKRQKDDPMFVKPDSMIKMHKKGVKSRKEWGEGFRKNYKEWRAEFDDYFTNEPRRRKLEWEEEQEKILQELKKSRDLLNMEGQELPEGLEQDIEFLESMEDEKAA